MPLDVKSALSQYRLVVASISVLALHVLIGVWLLHSTTLRGPIVSAGLVWASMEVVDFSESEIVLQQVPPTSSPPTEPIPNQTGITTESIPTPKADPVTPSQSIRPETAPIKTAEASSPASTWSGPLRVAPIPEPEGPAIAFVPAPKTTDHLCSRTQIEIDPSLYEKCRKSELTLP